MIGYILSSTFCHNEMEKDKKKKGEFIGYAKCMADMKRKNEVPAAEEWSRETG